MKRVITIVCLIIGFLFAANTATFAQIEDDDVDEENIDVGVGLVYGSEMETLGITADAYYGITNNFRVGGGLSYFFPNSEPGYDTNLFSIDLNGHYFFYSEDEVSIYGLTGLNIAFLSYNYEGTAGPDDTSNSEVGLNIGGGVEYALDFADLFGELKFAGIGGDADQLVLGAGLRFNL